MRVTAVCDSMETSQPLQRLTDDVAEIKDKLTAVLGVLHIFFDSWKEENEKTAQTEMGVDEPVMEPQTIVVKQEVDDEADTFQTVTAVPAIAFSENSLEGTPELSNRKRKRSAEDVWDFLNNESTISPRNSISNGIEVESTSSTIKQSVSSSETTIIELQKQILTLQQTNEHLLRENRLLLARNRQADGLSEDFSFDVNGAANSKSKIPRNNVAMPVLRQIYENMVENGEIEPFTIGSYSNKRTRQMLCEKAMQCDDQSMQIWSQKGREFVQEKIRQMKNNMKQRDNEGPNERAAKNREKNRKVWKATKMFRRIEGARAALTKMDQAGQNAIEPNSLGLILSKSKLQEYLPYLEDERFHSSEDEEEDEEGERFRFKRSLSFETDTWAKVKRYSDSFFSHNCRTPVASSRIKHAKDLGVASARSCPTDNLPNNRNLPAELFLPLKEEPVSGVMRF